MKALPFANVLTPPRLLAALICLIALTGCAAKMMPVPNLYAVARQPLFGALASEVADAHLEVLYVTDRAPEEGESGALQYGYERSASVA